MVEKGGEQYDEILSFRDYLRDNILVCYYLYLNMIRKIWVGIVLVAIALFLIFYYLGFVKTIRDNNSYQRQSNGKGVVGSERFGFEFEYPADWGMVDFVLSEGSARADNSGVTGTYFMGRFNNNELCQFRGVSPDFSAPMGGNAVLSGGWIKDGNNYLSIWPINYEGDRRIDYKEISETQDGREAVVVAPSASERRREEPPVAAHYVVYINLPGPEVWGIGIGCFADGSNELNPDTLNDMEGIVNSFRRLDK
ncbi:MAG: hypothetical protein O3A36_04225 [bacterium]|nr:hypothetical protein [bacterium]